jgi:carbamoyl-phosphate synthase large subunit
MSSEAVIGSLKQNRNNYIVGCDIYSKNWIAPSILVDSFYQVPFASNDNFVNDILSICAKEKIEYIIPLTDPEIDRLSESREILEKNSLTLCISDKKTIMMCRNKMSLYSLFQADKVINIIPTIDASMTNLNTLNLPLIAKPKLGRSSEGIFKIFCESDLRYFINKFPIEYYILQPLFSGEIYTVDLIRNAISGNCFSIVRQELIRTVNGAGITIKLTKNDQISEMAKNISKKIDIKGCVNFEFIKHDQKFYLMDINPRFSAGIAFSLIAGYNFVVNHMNCFKNMEIDPPIEYKEQILSKRYYEIQNK